MSETADQKVYVIMSVFIGLVLIRTLQIEWPRNSETASNLATLPYKHHPSWDCGLPGSLVG